MTARYECKLPPELMKKAVAELNEPEDNTVRLAAIDKLRKRFQGEEKDLELIRSDDAFLLRFLRVKKFNQDRAFATLKNYHVHRKENREIFEMVDNPAKVRRLLSAGAIIPMREGRAKDGTFVIMARPGHGFIESGDMLKFFACVLLTLEKLLEKEEFQINGVTVIQNMAEFSLSYVVQIASYGRMFFSIVQDAMPIRVKSLNMVNEALMFDAVWAVMSKFIKEKMKNRLQLHGSDFKTLHEKVDPTLLPFSLGGSGSDFSADWWEKEILSAVGGGEETEM